MAHGQLRTFHLFAGAGGGILADLLLGHLPVGACEIEEYPRRVLLQRQRDGILPEFPIWDDVQTLDGKPWGGSVEVLCGGFPCQDISAAGKGAGITGERSGLWREYARLIGEMRPKLVFAENSPLLRKRGLDVVLRDLANLGYNARWCVLGARDVGAPHGRKRMWIMAYSKLQHSKNSVCEENCRKVCARSKATEWGKNGIRSELVSRSNGFLYEEWSHTPRASDMVDGLARELDELKATGNGQVPQVAALAFSILSEGLTY